MNKAKRRLFNFLLGAIACVLLVGLSTAPSLSKSAQPRQTQTQINYHLQADLQEAESILMAQGASMSSLQRYGAILTKNNVVASKPATLATGVAGAALFGDRLVVRGDFGQLSSTLRDYAADPVDPPNPNITSAVHIHRGEPSQNGPFQYALTVTLNDTNMGGRFAGEYSLTPEQLQALAAGKLYVDLHTKQNRAGELRGILRPL